MLSIDVPSGWDVDNPDAESISQFKPAYNMSIMLPKICMQSYKGKHFLGGNFLSQKLADEFSKEEGIENLSLADFGADVFLEL